MRYTPEIRAAIRMKLKSERQGLSVLHDLVSDRQSGTDRRDFKVQRKARIIPYVYRNDLTRRGQHYRGFMSFLANKGYE